MARKHKSKKVRKSKKTEERDWEKFIRPISNEEWERKVESARVEMEKALAEGAKDAEVFDEATRRRPQMPRSDIWFRVS